MINNIKYLKATPKDEKAVIKLHALLYGDDNTKNIEKITGQVKAALQNKIVWIAKINNEAVGYVLCELFNQKHQYFPNSIFIDGLYVINEYRGKRIGKNLIEKVIKNKFPKQYTYFSITHDPASPHLTKFYQSLGFTKKGVTDAGNIMMTKRRID